MTRHIIDIQSRTTTSSALPQFRNRLRVAKRVQVVFSVKEETKNLEKKEERLGRKEGKKRRQREREKDGGGKGREKDVKDKIVNSGIPICLIATLRRLLNFLVELFRDEASEAEKDLPDTAAGGDQKRNRETSLLKAETDYSFATKSSVTLTAHNRRSVSSFLPLSVHSRGYTRFGVT